MQPDTIDAPPVEPAGSAEGDQVLPQAPEMHDAAEAADSAEEPDVAEADDAAAETRDAQPELIEASPELIDTGRLQQQIEALLFVASEALSIKAIARLTGAEQTAVTAALAAVTERFAERGIVVREIAGGYRFASAPAAREAVEAYLLPPKTTLSPAALETLAIVAYQQPVTKGEIEAIRGVNADSVVATLTDRRFIVEGGRKEVAGRPILYKTTPEFLEAFGLRSLEELPHVDLEAATPLEPSLPIEDFALAPPPAPAS